MRTGRDTDHFQLVQNSRKHGFIFSSHVRRHGADVLRYLSMGKLYTFFSPPPLTPDINGIPGNCQNRRCYREKHFLAGRESVKFYRNLSKLRKNLTHTNLMNLKF
jgi:hypothetical protein